MNKWKKVKISDSFILQMGKTPSRNEPSFWNNPFYNWVSISDMNQKYIYATKEKISPVALEKTGMKKVPKGTIMLSFKLSLGKVSISAIDLYTNEAIMSFFPKNKNEWNIDFLYNYFKWLDWGKKAQKAVKGATLNKNSLGNIEIPLPAMEEQKKIAARLDAVSDLLAKQKQLLSEQDNLIQSTFYDMFGDPIKNEKGWNSKKLSELGSLKNGINFQKNDNESDLYCLGVADFKDNKYISDISALQKVPSKSVNLTEDLLKNGDIVFVRSNGNKALVGRCVAVYPNEEAVTFSGFCIRFRKSTTLIKIDYLLYFLKTPQVRNALAGRGANIQNLNQQILSRVNILCPPLELQQKFAAVAEQIESEKSKIKSAIAETQTLFNALMSEYFED